MMAAAGEISEQPLHPLCAGEGDPTSTLGMETQHSSTALSVLGEDC